jgi:hypothetical protein
MNPPQEQTAADEFNAREYFLEMTQDSTQADDDFNAREWFLAGAAEQEAEAAHLERLLGGGSFPELQIQATADDGFNFSYYIADPQNFTTDRVHDELLVELQRIGYNPVVMQVSTVLEAGMTTGIIWVARQ